MNTKDLIREIFSQPTAPFREQFVLEKIEALAHKKRLPFVYDSFGNLVVGINSVTELKTGQRLLLFAHTDHPGFHILKQNGNTLLAKWYGGAPFEHMKNASVRIYDPSLAQISYTGKITSIENRKYKRTGMKMQIQLDREFAKDTKVAKGSFGAFNFPKYTISKQTISTRVADDLAGCVIALGAVLDARRLGGRVVAVFTRAEEVGFIGCWSFLTQTAVSKSSIAISLEASRNLPGAELSKGPVLRLGDRSTLFDNNASQFMWVIAQRLQKKNKNFKYQRRIMDGGSCEATALNLFGLRTTGLAVPLKNYHNQGDKGKPAPEIIHLTDVENARLICAEVGRRLTSFNKESLRLKKSLTSNHKVLSRLLGAKSKPTFLETRL